MNRELEFSAYKKAALENKEKYNKLFDKISEIKLYCRKLVENYKKYPVKVKNTEQAMELGKALTADSILEIINNEQKL